MKTLTFEDLLEELGSFGRYQKFVCVLCLFLDLVCSFITFSSVFVLTVPDHRCALPGLANDTFAVQNEFHFQLINSYIPEDDDLSSCYLYRSRENSTRQNQTTSGDPGDRDLVKCDRWVYDKTFQELTMVEQLNLVCDKKAFRAHANFALMLGKLTAALVNAAFCDLFGRKRLLMIYVPVTIFVLFANAFLILNIPLLLLWRFLLTAFGNALYYNGLIIALELSGNSKRNLLNIIYSVVWISGGFLTAGLSYIFANYVDLFVTMAVPSLLFASYYWLLPESPRWLLAKGRTKEARDILEKVARINKKPFPHETFNKLTSSSELSIELQVNSGGEATFPKEQKLEPSEKGLMSEEVFTEKEVLNSGEEETHITPSSNSSGGILQLVKSKKMLTRCCITALEWAIVNIVYYSIMFNVSNLPGSVFVNFILLVSVDMLRIIPLYFFVDRIGRKKTYSVSMLIAVVGCLSTLLPHFFMSGTEQSTAYNIFSLVGRMGISSAYCIIVLYTAELFPTTLRLTAIGISGISSKIGGSLAPYIADLGLMIGGPLAEILPLLVCSGAGMVGLVMVLSLPETTNQNLPDNVTDALESNGSTTKKNHSDDDMKENGVLTTKS